MIHRTVDTKVYQYIEETHKGSIIELEYVQTCKYISMPPCKKEVYKHEDMYLVDLINIK